MGVDLDGNGTYENNEKISYDAIGNPTKYLGNDLLWTGRELYRYQNNDFRNTYYYDSEGLRSRKNIYVSNGNGGYTYNGKIVYQYLGGLLTYQCTYNAADELDTEMYFFYDSYNKLIAIRYIKGTTDHYYYVTTNMHGDVLGIYSASGALLASYDYDAWGNCTVNTVNSNYTIGYDNPIRYRGYYYDNDLGLYYLKSRYYNPEIGRFLNSDNVSDPSAKILGYNFFVYCGNNPVINSDPTGHGIIKDVLKCAYKIVTGAVRSSVGKLNVAVNISQNINLQIGNVTVGVAGGISLHANGDVSGSFNFSAGGTASTSPGGGGVSSQTCVGLDFVPDFDDVLDSGTHVSVGVSAPIPYTPISGEGSLSFNDYDGKNEIYNGFSIDAGASFPKGAPNLNVSTGFDNTISSKNFDNVYDMCDAFFVAVMGE